jgi:cation:H+ antiporter
MAIDVVMLIGGLVVLYYGAEYLVRGAANSSTLLGVSPLFIGLTVVAFGTSLPELVVSLTAVLRDSNDIALGNVVGSNIANIGLVLAAGAFLFTVNVPRKTLKRDIPLMFLFTGILIVLSIDRVLSRMEGSLLATGLILFTLYCARAASKETADTHEAVIKVKEPSHEIKSLGVELVICAGGIAAVILGAHFLVKAAVALARAFHVSEMVIGMTVVAVGTSLPELATTVVAAYRKQSDIAVGNVIGSNIFNIGFVLGMTALARPVFVPGEIITGEMLVMVAFGLAILPSAARFHMDRLSGGALLGAYALFVLWQAGVI